MIISYSAYILSVPLIFFITIENMQFKRFFVIGNLWEGGGGGGEETSIPYTGMCCPSNRVRLFLLIRNG